MPEASSIVLSINGVDARVTTDSRQIVDNETEDLQPGQVPLSTIVESTLFRNWTTSIKIGYTLTKVVVKAVTMFGPRVGFLYIEADITDFEGRKLPGVVFLRGDSVAMLVELRTLSNRYALLVRQARTPAGGAIYETPAGMLDDSGDFKGVAFTELADELPALKGMFTLERERVTRLHTEPVWMSPGGCDERMGFFHLLIETTDEEIQRLHGSVGGLDQEGEYLVAAVVPWEQLSSIPDAKLLIALALLGENTVRRNLAVRGRSFFDGSFKQ